MCLRWLLLILVLRLAMVPGASAAESVFLTTAFPVIEDHCLDCHDSVMLEGDRPLADLWLTLLGIYGIKADRFADSTSILEKLS